jgi:Mg/Co/Ni transporter MgtE
MSRWCGSGGNSGSQATTLIIRALALREVCLGDWWRVMRREVYSGLAFGAVLGTTCGRWRKNFLLQSKNRQP